MTKSSIKTELLRFQNKTQRFRGLSKEDVEIMLQFFNNYFGGIDNYEERDNISEADIIEILSSPDDFMFNLVNGIKSYPRDKAVLTDRIIKFLDYLEIRFDVSFNKHEFENFRIKSQSERLLQILKYLHSGDKNRAQIADAFGISERTLSEDLAILLDGFEFLGTEMKISSLERGTNKYRSHVHPIFLALNSAEIFDLTIGLKLAGKDTVFESGFSRIANLVYKQLSHSAKEMIDKSGYSSGLFDDEKLKFKNSLEANEDNEKFFSYFLKDGTKCNIKFRQEEEIKEEKGVIKIFSIGARYNLDRIMISSEDKEITLGIEKVIIVERDDKEEYFSEGV